MKNIFLPFILLLTFVFSCRENDNEEILEKKNQSYDVYVAGRENSEACYWKNTVKTVLSSGSNYVATKIFVNNNDVYVLGYNFTVITPQINYSFWKNNIKYDIASYLGIQPNTTTLINFNLTDFFIKNGDFYIAGLLYNPNSTSSATQFQYCYWKNGVKTVVFEQNEYYSSAKLHVFGNDIYVPLVNNIITSPTAPTTWDLGYYKNGSYHFVTTLANCLDLHEINGSVKMLISDLNNQTIYYKDLITNTTSSPPSFITFANPYYKLYKDGTDNYFVGGAYYYKNNIQYNQYQSGSNYIFMDAFKPLDGKIYKIFHTDDNTGVNYNVYANDMIIQSTSNGTNSTFSDTEFLSLDVVPN